MPPMKPETAKKEAMPKGLREEEKMHTPTPWYQDGVAVMRTSGDCICEAYPMTIHAGIGQTAHQEANAAFIVRAVNAYCVMLAALKRIHETCNVSEMPRFDDNYLDRETNEQLQAAIAKAEGR